MLETEVLIVNAQFSQFSYIKYNDDYNCDGAFTQYYSMFFYTDMCINKRILFQCVYVYMYYVGIDTCSM